VLGKKSNEKVETQRAFGVRFFAQSTSKKWQCFNHAILLIGLLSHISFLSNEGGNNFLQTVLAGVSENSC